MNPESIQELFRTIGIGFTALGIIITAVLTYKGNKDSKRASDNSEEAKTNAEKAVTQTVPISNGFAKGVTAKLDMLVEGHVSNSAKLDSQGQKLDEVSDRVDCAHKKIEELGDRLARNERLGRANSATINKLEDANKKKRRFFIF